MDRTLIPPIRQDLAHKIILLSGPRQSGKTTLAKMLEPDHDYVNFDHVEHRRVLAEQSWDRRRRLLILDELHKMPRWKGWLKGIYDTEGLNPPIIVTGSARLDIFRKVGDSLAGRYFPFRLHPLDLKELRDLSGDMDLDGSLEQLMQIGGFPEPFLKGSARYYQRWRRTHLDIILRQDLIQLEDVPQLVQVETLVELLRDRVGSPLSQASLARDLGCSDKSVKRWLSLLESMYVIFRVGPFHRNIARALKKSAKYYFFDTGQLRGDNGIKLENVVAGALLKEIHRRADCLGELWGLHYLRTRQGKEVDFVLTQEGKAKVLIEVTSSGETFSPHLRYFADRLPDTRALQIVRRLKREKTLSKDVEMRRAAPWLSLMSF